MRKQYHNRDVNGDRHIWDVHKLVRASQDLPVISIALVDIAELDELWWFQTADDIPTPRSIAEHMQLVQQTDLRFPILLCSDGRLMDGMHRVVKALSEGRDTIQAIRFPQTPAPDFINVDVNTLPQTDEEI
ncbi:MAG: hypothetical protein JXQ85_06160 [Cognatishimia sp.]|uniref:hypothetical protein n=1 Tax=Cognatishimia sp. TaxID=2211648 RepID=UPI003B8D0C5A